MNILYSWLQEFVSPLPEPEQLSHALTMLGLEIESQRKIPGSGLSNGADWVFEVSITPNRGDCMSHLGIAREVAALSRQPLKLPLPPPPKASIPETPFTVTVEAPDLCPRYLGRVIRGVKVAPSPKWLSDRLEACGVRSISNVVDATNYVLLERGHPLHAFDAATLAGQAIVVRRPKDGEFLTTLDGAERKLGPEMCVICDGENPVALAGVMGGANTEVRDETVDLFLESALFNPASIRRTSRDVGLRSESSQRFERGVDHRNAFHALNRLTNLILELAGGKVEGPVLEHSPGELVELLELSLRIQRVRQVLGIPLEEERIAEYLDALGMGVLQAEEGTFTVSVPPHRNDIQREIDLVEEVARLYGYNRIPTIPLSERYDFPDTPRWEKLRTKFRSFLTANGFQEVVNYSFTRDSAAEAVKDLWFPGNKVAALSYPLSKDQGFMRTSQIPGLVENTAWNCNRNLDRVKIFEIGKAFGDHEPGTLPEEALLVTGMAWGTWQPAHWEPAAMWIADFFDLKGTVEALLTGAGAEGWTWKGKTLPGFAEGYTLAAYLDETLLAAVGKVSDEVTSLYDFTDPVWGFELHLDRLANYPAKTCLYHELPKLPPVKRDLSLVLDREIPFTKVRETIGTSQTPCLSWFVLTDLYSGKQVPEGKKSLTFHLQFHREDRALTDQEANEYAESLVAYLREHLGAELR